MKSMTGYGCANTVIGGYDVNLDLTSVNKRGLDLYVSLPREWQIIERDIVTKAREVIVRGKVNFYFSVKAESQNDGKCWNPVVVRQMLDELRSIARLCDMDLNPDGDLLLRIAQSSAQQMNLPSADDAKGACLNLVAQAVEHFEKMRIEEGSNLKVDLEKRLYKLTELANRVQDASQETVPQYREQLLDKLKAIDIGIDLNDERVLKEIALFADRVDNSEELTRLDSHVAQFHAMLSDNKPVGRPMDFLCQEINREINTIGSKANNAEITKSVLDMKNELEKIREQVQNIE